ncbi:MAG: arylsulfatase [Verrucomicrobiales bacterium]
MTTFIRALSRLSILLGLLSGALVAAEIKTPNIIFILADDLGYGDLGSYGQKVIQTPRLDRMAAEGIRFTQFYAGATVCAPSRSVLMTGQHGGRTRVRGNGPGRTGRGQELRAVDVTVAEVMREAGYVTALIGKWGLGEHDTPGGPLKQGFDSFYGYTDQTHAHNHFPNFLWRNDQRDSLPNDIVPVGRTEGAGYATKRLVYAGDRFIDEALAWIDGRAGGPPFFLLLSLISPHANNERTRALGDGAEVPDHAPYAEREWSDPTKGFAAMITRLDTQVGRVLDHLKVRDLDERTIVFFSSDNGPHREAGHDTTVFHSSGPFRGWKRDLTEGGLRVPMIARWPGHIPAGRVTGHVASFSDFLATAAGLAGFDPPSGLNSISQVPVLTGREADQPKPSVLYWEFHERAFDQAVLMDGRWKAIRRPAIPNQTKSQSTQGEASTRDGLTELYDLQEDPSERNNLARKHPDRIARAESLFLSERSESEDWPAGTR